MEIAKFISRLLLVSVYIYSGVDNIVNYTALKGYILSQGALTVISPVMTHLLPVAIAIDFICSLCIIFKFYMRSAAAVLGFYTLFLNFDFNMNFSNKPSTVIFFLELSLVGALFLIAMGKKEKRSSISL